MNLVSHLAVDWMCVDDVGDLFQSYCSLSHIGTINWSIDNISMCNTSTLLLRLLLPNRDISFLSENQSNYLEKNYTGIDAIFIPYHCSTVSDWSLEMVGLVNLIISKCSNMSQASLWIPQHFPPSQILPSYTSFMTRLSPGWMYSTHIYDSVSYGDCLTSHCICFQMYKLTETGTLNAGKYEIPLTQMDCGYNNHINISYNDEVQDT